jgi:YD repeat-containing protein
VEAPEPSVQDRGGRRSVVSPWWPAANGIFLPYAVTRANLTPEARLLAARLAAADLPGSVFLRGSIVESCAPFAGSDVDVLVLAEEGFRPAALDGLSHRPLDVKLLTRERLRRDLVQHALLAHRAVRVAGPDPALDPVASDDEFAWRHWLAYFPAGLPARIDSTDRLALYTWKCAVRSFGVLSLMRDGRFTRDVDACLRYAGEVASDTARTLVEARSALERREQVDIRLSDVRTELLRLHRASA